MHVPGVIAALLAVWLSLLASPNCPAQEQVIFEDKFDGPCSPKWKFEDGDWAVVDGRFKVVNIQRGYIARALLDLPLPDDFAIELTFSLSSRRLYVYVAYESPEKHWGFFLPCWGGAGDMTAGWFREMPGRGLSGRIAEKQVSSQDKYVLRIEVRRNLLVANMNGEEGWEWATTIPRARIGVGGGEHSGEIYSFKVIRIDPVSKDQNIDKSPRPEQSPAFTQLAPFAVDPRDVDRLASQLARECQRNEQAKRRMQEGAVAIATFDLVDIPSPSVARNVAEDLYTSMTQAGFQLIERGQLDKVMKELRLQTTDAIDSAQAQRLGNLTGASLILVGSISDRGSFVVINVRLLETSTGTAVAATRVEMRKVKIER